MEREQGHSQVAIEHASEAVTLYRQLADVSPVEMANALRVWALAQAAEGDTAATRAAWREARKLYATARIEAGVTECEMHLRRGP